jgi:hypothetical protein
MKIKCILRNLYLKQITSSYEFFILFDELIHDNSGFLYNRETILNAYIEGTLYSLKMTETDEMFADRHLSHPMWARMLNGNTSNYLLPSVNEAVIIWVHTRIRSCHVGSILIELLKINYAEILPESIGFWQKCGFQIEKKNSGQLDIATKHSFIKQTRSGLIY